MKGLILKDLYTVRFQMIAGLFLILLPNCLTFLAGNDFVNGSVDNFSRLMLIVLYGFLNFSNICLFSSFILNTLGTDVSSGWINIQRTFPVSGNVVIGAKLAASGIIVAVLTLMSLAFNIAAAFLFELNMELMISIPLCIGVYQMIVLAPLFPIAMKIGARYTSVLYIVTEGVVLILMIWLLATIVNNGADLVLLRSLFYGGLPCLAAASGLLSYLSGKKAILSCK